MPLQPGLSAEVEHLVSDADTALAVGSGDVPVLATPRVLALAEAATVAALVAGLEPGQTTVGTRVALEHIAPTSVGSRVVARAQLVVVDGRLLQFDVVLEDADGAVVAHGRITRVVVDRERFVGALGADLRRSFSFASFWRQPYKPCNLGQQSRVATAGGL